MAFNKAHFFVSEILHHVKGHQGSNPGGLHFRIKKLPKYLYQ